jgi:undecaprenyl diphosphate synthase
LRSEATGRSEERVQRGPRHVAIIMDGNGRWAKRRGLPRVAGHRAGTENIRRILERFADHGVEYVTLYAFSTENWGRPRSEVNSLMRILRHVIKRETRHFVENGIQLRHIGDLEALPPRLRQEVEDSIEQTSHNRRMVLTIAFNYGGRADIVQAIQQIVADGVPAHLVDETVVSRYLYTAGNPDPDLIIRTAGEMRISNFLLWQGAYAEMYVTDTCWPDFGREDVDAAMREYARRTRTYGALPDPAAQLPVLSPVGV